MTRALLLFPRLQFSFSASFLPWFQAAPLQPRDCKSRSGQGPGSSGCIFLTMPRQEIRDQHKTGWFPSFSRKAWVESIPFVIKSQLVLNVAVQLRSIRQRAVMEAVDAIFDRMGSALAHGDRVELRGFGDRRRAWPCSSCCPRTATQSPADRLCFTSRPCRNCDGRRSGDRLFLRRTSWSCGPRDYEPPTDVVPPKQMATGLCLAWICSR